MTIDQFRKIASVESKDVPHAHRIVPAEIYRAEFGGHLFTLERRHLDYAGTSNITSIYYYIDINLVGKDEFKHELSLFDFKEYEKKRV